VNAATSPIPRWRGFNIVDLFSTSVRWKEFFPMDDGLVAEEDFVMIRELGFDFVRIPMSYLFFGTGPFGRTPDPERLWLIDRVVEFGRKHGVHVMLAFHRAPGYCVTAESQFDFPEKGSLFENDDDLRDFTTWWATLAERYRDVPREALSFNLVNEPMNLDPAGFERTFVPVIEAIEAVTPERLIHVEGTFVWGADTIRVQPAPDSIATRPNVVNSVHLYHPVGLTHYDCPWLPSPLDLQPPTWPYEAKLLPGVERELTGDDAKVWDREALRELLQPYLRLVEQGHAVHVGEMGSYSKVPHDVYLAYLKDVVGLLGEYGLGYAMWNFRGPFGVVDTGRDDVAYEEFHGHRLDRALVDVLAQG
jgi:endoglucanase